MENKNQKSKNNSSVESRLNAIRNRLKSQESNVTEVQNSGTTNIDNLAWNNRGWENGWANWGNYGT